MIVLFVLAAMILAGAYKVLSDEVYFTKSLNATYEEYSRREDLDKVSLAPSRDAHDKLIPCSKCGMDDRGCIYSLNRSAYVCIWCVELERVNEHLKGNGIVRFRKK